MINFIRISSLIISLYTTYKCIFKISNEYKLLFIIPLIYCVFILFSKSIKNKFNKNKFIFFLILVLYVKDCIMPFFMIFYDNFDGIGLINPNKYILKSIIFIALELIFIMITIIFVKISNKRNKDIKYINNINIYILVGIIGLIFSIKYPYLFIKISDVIGHEKINIINEKMSSIEIIATYFINVFKISIFILLINYLYIKYKKNKKLKFFIFSIFITIIYGVIWISSSRFTFIVTFISAILILIDCFNKYKKFIIGFSIVSITIILVFISSYKTFNTSNKDTNISKLMQAYLSGPRNVAYSLEMLDYNDILCSPKLIINDVLHPVPIVGKKFRYDSTTELFNITVYKSYISKDQIVPFIGQIYSYFNLIGFILIPIYIKKSIEFSEFDNAKIDIDYKYFKYLIIIWLSLIPIINITILIQNIIYFTPFYIVIKTNKKFKNIKIKK
ncbi:hypothetical protein KLF29_02495 [Clostridium perfringens]|uniref:hypothetical protein n=1 Tax=Clostridium perfringens TaxID=1502 RepID=UPI001CCE19D9|nr:hypothetical protein [Clostridium perfringens]UBK78246.1 hypothetical protein KLF29_02495 [Clostridium perfringens]